MERKKRIDDEMNNDIPLPFVVNKTFYFILRRNIETRFEVGERRRGLEEGFASGRCGSP